MSYLVITGDKHIRPKEPYCSSILKVLDWFLESEYNHEDNIYFSLGDETEESINKGAVNDYLLSFYSKLKMKKKYILKGNHDESRDHGCNLDIFNSDSSVEVIHEYAVMNFGVSQCLLLPYIYPKDGRTMEDIYSNSLSYKETFDYCLGHVFDETKQFSKNQSICDLSGLNIKQRLFGHDHGFDLDKGGNYLGSMHPNSNTEKNKNAFFYVIDLETGEGKAVPIPRFLNFYDVMYPDKLPIFEEPYQVLRIIDYVDREATIKLYTEQMLSQNKGFYKRRMERKKLAQTLENVDIANDTKLTLKQHLVNYFQHKKVD